jgi:hypothetical protein
MTGLRILITNLTLATRTGTELFVRDLATGLLDRGFTPIVYSAELGPLADELRAAAVAVVDDLGSLATAPDMIHGHHNLPTMRALLRFANVPAVFFCHDARSWHDSPPRSPRIRRYVAVDLACRDRLVLRHGIPEDRVRLLLNFVDLKRFTPRAPLPPRPARALVFSNNANERTHVGAVREACGRAGIALDVIGAGAGNICARPEEALGRYDLVFAKGRCALEAIAVGAAVVLCDAAGTGPMATTGQLDRLRHLNFGRRALSGPVHPDVIGQEIARYDAKDAAEVSCRIRATAGRDEAVDRILALYHEALAEHLNGRGFNGNGSWRAVSYFRMLGWRMLRLAWRVDRRYGPMKYRVVLPASQWIKALLGPQGAERGGSTSLAAGVPIQKVAQENPLSPHGGEGSGEGAYGPRMPSP